MEYPYLASYQQAKFISEPEAYLYEKIGTRPLLPITIAELQDQCRIDVALEQQSYFNLIISSVVMYVERYTSLSCIAQQYLTYRDSLKAPAIELRKGYFITLDEFKYFQYSTQTWETIDASVYQIDKRSYFAQILPMPNQCFPSEAAQPTSNSVQIKFTAGMATTPALFETICPDLKLAMMQHCVFLYENRGNDVAALKNDANAIPQMILDVYDRYKVPSLFSGVISNING